MDYRTNSSSSHRSGNSSLLLLGGFALGLTALGCSSDEAVNSGGGDGGPSASGSGGQGGGSGGSSGGAANSGGGGASTSGGKTGSGGSTGSSGGSAGSSSGGAKGACASGADCSSTEDCCVTISIDQMAVESSSTACAATCEVRSGSTGTGSLIHSVVCAAKADCAGVVNEFGVNYSQCCSMPGSALGVCVSETDSAFTFEDSGGTCK